MRIVRDLAAVVAAALILASGVDVPTAARAGLRFSTKPEAIPKDLEPNWASQGRAHELINQMEMIVVLGTSSPEGARSGE
jgi:hypothetical protein